MQNSSASRKRQGEWAEVCFLGRVLALGMNISKPYGDNTPYDFVVDCDGFLRRVQVKSCAVRKPQDGYRITMGHGITKRAYRQGELDLLAAYIIPHDAWYLVPLSAIGSVRALWFCPHRPSRRKFETYREAWHLLTPV